MTAKEKSHDIYNYYYQMTADSYRPEETAKEFSLYFVDGIMDALCSDRITYGSVYRYEESNYWEEVKTELEKL